MVKSRRSDRTPGFILSIKSRSFPLFRASLVKGRRQAKPDGGINGRRHAAGTESTSGIARFPTFARWALAIFSGCFYSYRMLILCAAVSDGPQSRTLLRDCDIG
jgi:hypothetical protein